MKKCSNDLTQEYLKSILRYNPETGNFHWTWQKSDRVLKNSVAGTNRSNKCIIICINLKKYRAHRLAWLYMTGEWPKKDIDHINRNPLDNSWANLRECTISQNGYNTTVRPHSKTGFKGVHQELSGRYSANATIKGVRYYIGVYDTPEEANAAFIDYVKEEHGEFLCE